MNRCCLSDLSNVITIIPFFPCPDIKHSTTEECFLLDSLTRMLILCSYQLESQYGQMAGKSVALFQNQKRQKTKQLNDKTRWWTINFK